MGKSEDFYQKLKIQLNDTSSWPSIYLFKFIIKTDSNSLVLLKQIFSSYNSQISTKLSKNNKYTSVSIKGYFNSSTQIINLYKEVGLKVKDVISL